MIFLALLVGNAFIWQQSIVGGILLVAFVVGFGTWVGRWAAPDEQGVVRIWIGTWMLLSTVMLAGSAAYYVAEFTRPVAVMLAGFTGLAAWWLSRHAKIGWLERPHDLVSEAKHWVVPSVWLAAAIAMAALSSLAWMLSSAATVDSVRSAWTFVPASVFLAFGLALTCIFALLIRGKERTLSILLCMAALFLFLAAAIIIFPLGFGFDPFIHQATEEHIAIFGSITPKPFYYVGQYALVLFIHHVFSLPIASINTLLVPLLAALSLPIAWYAAAAHLLRDRRVATATLAGLFLIPLGSFILTTPQGLANLWTLLLILAAVPALVRDERPHVWPLVIPSLAALAVHPIAGLPAVLFVILLASDPVRNASRPVVSRIIFWSGAAVGCVVLPLSFMANSLRSTGSLGINLSSLSNLSILSSLSPFLANRFNPLLDFVYLYGYNAITLIVAIALIGWWISRKLVRGALRIPTIMAAALAINWFLLSTAVDFSFLIDYERQNFAARLVPLAAFFLVPFLILAVGTWMARVRQGPVSLRVGTIVLLAALGTASFYLAYPRNDAYETGHGFNVSQTDVDAVHAIENDAAGAAYAVLANQTVSAAAVRELGFVRYFGDQFFYPIPTGGDLYALFLRMNDGPSLETATQALNLVNIKCAADQNCTQAEVTTLYYVVNDYWWEAPRIVETAKGTTTDWWALDGGAVHVFKFLVDKSR